MDLQSLIAAYALLAAGVHPLGHVDAGNEQGSPVKVNYKTLSESWDRRKGNQAEIDAGGFHLQDKVVQAADDENMDAANALYKTLYLAGINKIGKAKMGDIENMARASGNKYTQALFAASILSDIYQAKNPDSKWSYNFDVIDGSPGGRINYKW